MSLSDCPECWDIPCTCGEYWKDWTDEAIVTHLFTVVRKLPKPRAFKIVNDVNFKLMSSIFDSPEDNKNLGRSRET